jgi:hypothetical protein
VKYQDILSIRDELDERLREVEGVISVGVGKARDDYVLVVLIDPNVFQGGIPSRYHGVSVIAENPGRAESYTDGGADHGISSGNTR